MQNQQKIRILDGAVGSLLQQKFPELYDSKIWMNRIINEKPEELYKIHQQYQIAGANILTTFTFKTNPQACSSLEESKTLVKKAVELAHRVKQDNPKIQICGSNSPAEDCYQKERTLTLEQLTYNHKNHIQFLKDQNVDFILNETMSHLDELIIVCQTCKEFNVPYVISIYFDKNLQLLSGEKVDDCIDVLLNKYHFKPQCISFNCIQKQDLLNLIESSKNIFFKKSSQTLIQQDIQYGFYVNCGGEDYSSNNFSYSVSPQELPLFYQQIIDTKVIDKESISFLGSCCMSTPEHTASLSKYFS